MKHIIISTLTLLATSISYGQALEGSYPGFGQGIAMHAPKVIIAACSNTKGSAEVFTIGGTLISNDGTSKFIPDYRVLLNEENHRVQLTNEHTDTVSFKKEEYDRGVDLIVYVYKPGTVSSSNIALEIFEDDWNGIGGKIAEFSQDECTVNF